MELKRRDFIALLGSTALFNFADLPLDHSFLSDSIDVEIGDCFPGTRLGSVEEREVLGISPWEG